MKRLISMLSLIFLLFSLQGCGSKSKPVVNETESLGRIIIHWWSFPVFAQNNVQGKGGSFEEELIRAFEAKHPNIKVVLTRLDFTTGGDKLELDRNTKKQCDVLFDAPGRIIAYGKAGQLVKLNDFFDADYIEDVHNNMLLQACKDKKDVYMYPLSSAPFYLAFNKAMLQDAGVLHLVKEGWTPIEFLKVLEALKGKGYAPGSVFCKDQGGDQATRAFLGNMFDSGVTDREVTYYTLGYKNGVKAARFMKQCVDKGLMLNGSYNNGTKALEDFVNGYASFSLLWGPNQQNTYAGILKSNGIEVVEVPYPSQDGRAEFEYLVNGFCVMNNGNADQIEASKEFIRFVCDDLEWGPKSVIQTGCIPVRNSFGKLYNDKRMDTINKWTADYAPYYNTVDGFAQMRKNWVYALQSILNGYQAPAEALTDFAQASDALIKSSKGSDAKEK